MCFVYVSAKKSQWGKQGCVPTVKYFFLSRADGLFHSFTVELSHAARGEGVRWQ